MAGGWLSNALARAGSVFSRAVAVELPREPLQMGRLGGSLTPADVSQILLDADMGRLQRRVDLFDESRQKDGTLHAVCSARESEVARLRPQVTPASSRRRDKKIAAWVAEWITAFGADEMGPRPRDLSTLIRHLQSALWHGHAVSGIVYERDGGYEVPRACDPVHPRRFIYDEAGTLRLYDLDLPTIAWPGIDLLSEYPGRIVQYQPHVTGATVAREGLATALLWLALFRNWTVRDLMQLAELAWKPYRYAKFNKPAVNINDRDIAHKLRELTSNGFAVFPDCVDLTIEWAKQSGTSGGTGHLDLIAFLAAEMSKAVLGSTLVMDQSRVGSQALGKVHEKRLNTFIDADAAGVASILRRQVIGPAVRHNFGRDAAVPGFSLVTEDATDFLAVAQGFHALRLSGLRVVARDARDRLGLSEPLPGDEIFGDVVQGDPLPITGQPLLAAAPAQASTNEA